MEAGTEVTLISGGFDRSEMTDAQRDWLKKQGELQPVLSQVREFLESSGKEQSESVKSNPSVREADFLKGPPNNLSPEQFQTYRELRTKLEELRREVPLKSPTAVQRPNNFELVRTPAKIGPGQEGGGTIQLDIEGSEPPDASGYVVVDDAGDFLGLASRVAEGKCLLHSIAEIRAMSAPSVTAAVITLSGPQTTNGVYDVELTLDGSLGLGAWKDFYSVILPTEDAVEFPAGEGFAAVFNPTKPEQTDRIDKILAGVTEAMAGRSSTTAVIPPGETVSFTGQIFAEDDNGERLFFEPFVWSVARSREGNAFGGEFQPHPFAAFEKHELPEDEDPLQPAPAQFSDPIELPVEGVVLRALVDGPRRHLIVKTSKAPFLHRVDLGANSLSPLNFLGDLKESHAQGVKVGVGGDRVFILDTVSRTLSRWALVSGAKERETNIPSDETFVDLAVAANRSDAPILLLSTKGVHFLDQNTLSPVGLPFISSPKSKEKTPSFTFREQQDDSAVGCAIASADGSR